MQFAQHLYAFSITKVSVLESYHHSTQVLLISAHKTARLAFFVSNNLTTHFGTHDILW